MAEKTLYISDKIRDFAKLPFGTLVKDRDRQGLLDAIDSPTKLIAVGDATSSRLNEYGITPNMIIVDNKVERGRVSPVRYPAEKTYNIRNLPGTLSYEARATVAEAMRSDKRVRINVEGEEDLMTLLAVYEAPLGSAVLYGQPKVGVVVVKVDEKKKKEAMKILGMMASD